MAPHLSSFTSPLFSLAALLVQKGPSKVSLNKEASENGQRGDTDGAGYTCKIFVALRDLDVDYPSYKRRRA